MISKEQWLAEYLDGQAWDDVLPGLKPRNEHLINAKTFWEHVDLHIPHNHSMGGAFELFDYEDDGA